MSTWTPIDASGAGMGLTIYAARFVRVRHLVHVSADLQYPWTMNGANARIGGLPFPTAPGQSALAVGYHQLGIDFTLLVRANQTVIDPVTTKGALLTNAQLSGKELVFSGTYEAQPLPSVLSGQSNAANLALPLGGLRPVTAITQGATAIAAWAPDGAQWARLVPVLRTPIDAFIWWQGESDLTDLSHYFADLADLIARVRRTAVNPGLPVVICGANNYPGQQPLRDLQQAYVASDPGTIYVPSDDLASEPGSQHLTAMGYQTMADRIHAALQAAESRAW